MDLIARDFFDRPSDEVAPALLGCVLEHETDEGLVAVELTEVEAYAGETDPASHSYRGMTGRNAVMFGPPGYAYVYFTYGMHFCVNVTCMPEGIPRAVLMRAGRVIAGESLARRRRAAWRTESVNRGAIPARDLARGPARLCQALAITRTLNGVDLCSVTSELRLRPADTDRGADGEIEVSVGPRVGVSAAADVPWRFWIAGDPTVSPFRPHKSRNRLPAKPARSARPRRQVAPARTNRISPTPRRPLPPLSPGGRVRGWLRRRRGPAGSANRGRVHRSHGHPCVRRGDVRSSDPAGARRRLHGRACQVRDLSRYVRRGRAPPPRPTWPGAATAPAESSQAHERASAHPRQTRGAHPAPTHRRPSPPLVASYPARPWLVATLPRTHNAILHSEPSRER